MRRWSDWGMNYCQPRRMRCVAKYSFCMNLARLKRLSSLWNLLENITQATMRFFGSIARSKKNWGKVSLIWLVDYRKIRFPKKAEVIDRRRVSMLMKSWMKYFGDYVSFRTIDGCWFLTTWIENFRLHLKIWKSSMWKRISSRQITDLFLSLLDLQLYINWDMIWS